MLLTRLVFVERLIHLMFFSHMVYQVVGFSTIQVMLNYILHYSFLGMRGCAHLVLI